ncbi:uncharacterized protein LOC17877672 [Capsella rubella]|uniref:uncharacterized protein LOC17877672 n=1 Tax=Capsella rubella TaxID=81985 RepID=UPI000CD5342A|nr:uncharacterized protein LOC17877672 [Capsella rubella]
MSRQNRPSWYKASPSPPPSRLPVLEDEDDEVVILPQADNSAIVARLNLSLVGRMFHKGGRSMAALVATLPKEHIWDLEGRVRGVPIGDSRFQFFFETEEDLQKVLNKRPYHFNHWSFALERWEPHVGSVFPNSMTFWIRLDGIPSEFWTVASLTAFGASLGQVQAVDSPNGGIQVTVTADIALKFQKNAQIPSGETVPVSLLYEKLHRWCLYCRKICHESDSCPLLDKEQRKIYQRHYELQKAQRVSSRGPSRSLHTSAGGRRAPASRHFGRSSSHVTPGDSSQARVARKEKPRRDAPYQVPSRRAEASDASKLASSSHQHHSAQRKGKGKISEDDSQVHADNYLPPRNRSTLTIREGDGSSPSRKSPPPQASKEVPVVSDSQTTISAPYLSNSRAKQGVSSPAFTRDRPFRLSLQKQSRTGKAMDAIADSDPSPLPLPGVGSSAKKVLNFSTQETTPSELQPDLSLASLSLDNQNPSKPRRKSWYEMTLEEEEEHAGDDSQLQEPPLIGEACVPVPGGVTAHSVHPQTTMLSPLRTTTAVWDDALDFGQIDPQLDCLDLGDDDFGSMDEGMLENDDLLGDDLKAELQNQEALAKNHGLADPAPVVKGEKTRLRSRIVALISPPRDVSRSEPVTYRPRARPIKKTSTPADGPSKRGTKSPALMISSASRKIQMQASLPSTNFSPNSGISPL